MFFLVLFACKGAIPFCTSSKRKNHLKPVSLETNVFLKILFSCTSILRNRNVETEISIGPYSVYFQQKELKVILLYYLQILYGA